MTLNTFTPGTRLGPFEIVSSLGEGGMGAVYRARDTTLNREVAIKVLLPAVANDPERLARFQREAQVLASLNHPNIAHIHGLESFRSGGSSDPPAMALVLELVEGPTLADRIADGPIPLDEALPLARQIAEALEAAHEQGIIHRDLKPANIKVRPDGAVKVLDFGLAKAMEPPAGSSLGMSMSPTITTPAMTAAGMILGTAAYMSPEQASGKTVDKRSDLWAFGVVLLEMLTGRRVFDGETVSHVLASVLKDEPDWTTLPANTPAPIRRLLRRCLEKDRRRRLPDAAMIRLEIDEALTAPVEGTLPVGALAASSSVRSSRLWMLLFVGASLVASALAVLAVRHLRETPASPTLTRFPALPPPGAIRLNRAPFELSPDGHVLAYLGTGSGGLRRIFVRRLDVPEAQALANTDNAASVFWSPDSRALGFVRDGGLFRVDLDGREPPRRLCDVGSAFLSSSATWSPRGVIVFSSPGLGLQRVPDTGGTPTPVTTLDATAREVIHSSPWFLPDGEHLLFFALASLQTTGVIWATSIDDPARVRIVESNGGARYADGWLLSTSTTSSRALVAQRFDPVRLTVAGEPQPVRDGLVASTTAGVNLGFSVATSGVMVVDRPPPGAALVSQLTWVDRAGRSLSTVGPAGQIGEWALAPDETRVVTTTGGDLWLFAPPRSEGTRLTYQARASRPLWARDGRHVFFTGRGPTVFAPLTLTLGATDAAPVIGLGASFAHFEDVTRDGQYLVFKAEAQVRRGEVWLQRHSTPDAVRPLVQGQFEATQPRVSPDGRWLAFTLGLPSGPAVFAQPFDRPGERIQISPAGGIGPIWRDDSRELYYEGAEGLMVVPMSERADVLEAGTPRRLFPLHTQGFVASQPHNVEGAAHGQKFLVNAIVGDSDNVPLEVTVNWTEGLEK